MWWKLLDEWSIRKQKYKLFTKCLSQHACTTKNWNFNTTKKSSTIAPWSKCNVRTVNYFLFVALELLLLRRQSFFHLIYTWYKVRPKTSAMYCWNAKELLLAQYAQVWRGQSELKTKRHWPVNTSEKTNDTKSWQTLNENNASQSFKRIRMWGTQWEVFLLVTDTRNPEFE